MASVVDKTLTYPSDETDYNWLISDWEPGDNLWINVQGTYTVTRHDQGFIGVQLRHVCESLPLSQKSFAVIRAASGTDLEELEESPMIIAPSAGQFRRSPLPTGRLEFSSAHLGQEFIIKYISSGNVNNLAYAEEKSADIQEQFKRIFYKNSFRNFTIPDNTTLNVQKVAFGKLDGQVPRGRFIAVGGTDSGGTIVKSIYYSNGNDSFTEATSPVSRYWMGVAVGIDNVGTIHAVIVGQGATASSTSCIASSSGSSMGVTWTTRTAPNALNYLAVIHGGNKFVAVAAGTAAQTVITSNSSGSVWSAQTAHAGLWLSIAYGNSIFVAIGIADAGNRIMTSPDGVTWMLRNAPDNQVWTDIAYGNGWFVAVSNTGESTQRIMRSEDGINWTLATTPTELEDIDEGVSIAYGNGVFMVMINGNFPYNTMLSLDNGETWETGFRGLSPFGEMVGKLGYGNGKFAVVRADGDNSGGLQTLAAAETV